jgi:dienelactone hydrolase
LHRLTKQYDVSYKQKWEDPWRADSQIAGRFLLRDEAGPGGEVPSLLEAAAGTDRSHDGARDDRADTWYGHEAVAAEKASRRLPHHILSFVQGRSGAPNDTDACSYWSLDQWTPAADCSGEIDTWCTDEVPIEQVVYPGVHHSFYYQELQPGRTMFGYWVEYNEEAATDASRRMREFINRHLN